MTIPKCLFSKKNLVKINDIFFFKCELFSLILPTFTYMSFGAGAGPFLTAPAPARRKILQRVLLRLRAKCVSSGSASLLARISPCQGKNVGLPPFDADDKNSHLMQTIKIPIFAQSLSVVAGGHLYHIWRCCPLRFSVILPHWI